MELSPNEILRLLHQLKGDFDHIRREKGAIEVLLVHRATNAQAEGVVGYPSHHGPKTAGFGGAGHRNPFHRVVDGKMQFRSDPVVDVHGNPIVNAAGDALDIVMPAFRSLEFAGDGLVCQQLRDLGERAGRVVMELRNVPALAPLVGWRFGKTDEVWWAVIFEFAWANVHPFLTAERRLWLPADPPTTFIPYDLEQVQHLAEAKIGPAIPEKWLQRLPEAYVSEIKNAAAASFDAVDYLISQLTPASSGKSKPRASGKVKTSTSSTVPPEGTESASPRTSDSKKAKEESMEKLQRRFKVALSFPGEHRTKIGAVAERLAAVFTESRIFYDFFHKEELSRPRLDLYLQNIYQNESELLVVFICQEYDQKEWCGLEWDVIRSLIMDRARSGDVMFLRLDDKPVEGMLKTVRVY